MSDCSVIFVVFTFINFIFFSRYNFLFIVKFNLNSVSNLNIILHLLFNWNFRCHNLTIAGSSATTFMNSLTNRQLCSYDVCQNKDEQMCGNICEYDAYISVAQIVSQFWVGDEVREAH